MERIKSKKRRDRELILSEAMFREIRSRAFTLIELLVVIVIISVLVTITLIATATLRSTARDTRRKQDITVLQSATELYYQKFNRYPQSANPVGNIGKGWRSSDNGFLAPIKEAGLILDVPVDPLNEDQRVELKKGDFVYAWISDFTLGGTVPVTRKVYCPDGRTPAYTIEFTLEIPTDPTITYTPLWKLNNTSACNDQTKTSSENNPNGYTRYVVFN